MSKRLCQFSPDSKWVAFIYNNEVTVIAVSSVYPRNPNGKVVPKLEIVNRFSTFKNIDRIEWSKDSTLLLCAQYSIATVQVFSIQHTSWNCSVSEGIAGLVYSSFVPDCKNLLTISDFQLHITIWSITTNIQSIIENPKIPSKNGFNFSSDGFFLAIIHRQKCKDSIAIYSSTQNWKQIQHFSVHTIDAEEIVWNSSSDSLVLRDNSLEYLIILYNPANGEIIGRYKPVTNSLGASCLSWSPNSKYLLVGGYDGSLRVLNNTTWKPILEYFHPCKVSKKSSLLFIIPEKSICYFD